MSSRFSGQSFYEQWLYQCYNLIFTSTAIIWFALNDLEHPKEDFIKYPALYYKDIGQNNKLFDKSMFWRYIIQASGWSFFMVVLVGKSFEMRSCNYHGLTASFWIIGMIIYCYVVILVNFEVGYQTHRHCWLSITLQLGSILLFFTMYYFQNLLEEIPVFVGTFWYIWSTPQFYFCLLVLILGQYLCHMILNFLRELFDSFISKKLGKCCSVKLALPRKKQRTSVIMSNNF